MRNKNCDLIIANNISKKDSGFNSDYNQVSIIDNNVKIKFIKRNKKSFIAKNIAEIILDKKLSSEETFS